MVDMAQSYHSKDGGGGFELKGAQEAVKKQMPIANTNVGPTITPQDKDDDVIIENMRLQKENETTKNTLMVAQQKIQEMQNTIMEVEQLKVKNQKLLEDLTMSQNQYRAAQEKSSHLEMDLKKL